MIKIERAVVLAVLKVIRKRKWKDMAEMMDDPEGTIEDVIESLQAAGYAVVKMGAIRLLHTIVTREFYGAYFNGRTEKKP